MSAVDADRWWREVRKRPDITAATKVLLVTMADEMRGGHISVPRSVLATMLGIHPSRVTKRIREAVEVGVLQVVVTGQPGVTAVYAPMLGAPVRTKARPQDGAPVRTSAWCGVQDQEMVHPSAPSDGEIHAQLGAPVQSASSTQPQQSDLDVPHVVGQTQERGDRKTDKPESCVDCGSLTGRVGESRCLDCLTATIAIERAAAAS